MLGGMDLPSLFEEFDPPNAGYSESEEFDPPKDGYSEFLFELSVSLIVQNKSSLLDEGAARGCVAAGPRRAPATAPHEPGAARDCRARSSACWAWIWVSEGPDLLDAAHPLERGGEAPGRVDGLGRLR